MVPGVLLDSLIGCVVFEISVGIVRLCSFSSLLSLSRRFALTGGSLLDSIDQLVFQLIRCVYIVRRDLSSLSAKRWTTALTRSRRIRRGWRLCCIFVGVWLVRSSWLLGRCCGLSFWWSTTRLLRDWLRRWSLNCRLGRPATLLRWLYCIFEVVLDRCLSRSTTLLRAWRLRSCLRRDYM